MASSAETSATDESPPPTRVLLAVSCSSLNGYPHPSISSTHAYRWILRKLIRPGFRQAFQLLILHVQVPDEDAFDDMDSLYATGEDFKDMKYRERSRGLHLLERFVKHCNEVELPCQAWIKEGDPKEVICKEILRVHPDLLVLGSRGLGTLQKLFVGTVSEYCTKHAECPVLVIRRKPEDSPEDPMDD